MYLVKKNHVKNRTQLQPSIISAESVSKKLNAFLQKMHPGEDFDRLGGTATGIWLHNATYRRIETSP